MRQAPHQVSERMFVCMIAALLLYGLGISALVAYAAPHGINPALTILAGVALLITGLEVAERAPQWWLSLAAHTLSNAGIGLFILTAGQFGLAWAFRSLVLLAAGVLALCLVGTIYPPLLRGLGAFAFALTLGGLVVFILPDSVVPSLGHFGTMDFVAAGVVLAFLDHYWGRALSLTRSANSAVDASCAVYVEGANRLVGALTRIFRP